MSGYIKYFENGGKNMSFVIKNDDVLDKYNEIWNKIKEKLNIKFHSMPVYDEKYIKTEVREYNRVIKTNFLSDEIPKENMHYTWIACTAIDSVTRMEKKNYPQFYLEECKYRMKKTKIPKFIEAELESESELELESDTELEANLKSDSGFDSFLLIWLLHRWLLTNFECVKKIIVILLTLNKSKKLFVTLLTLKKPRKLIAVLLTLNKPKKLLV